MKKKILSTILSLLIVMSLVYALNLDYDGVDNSIDNCPYISNPTQSDVDYDAKFYSQVDKFLYNMEPFGQDGLFRARVPSSSAEIILRNGYVSIWNQAVGESPGGYIRFEKDLGTNYNIHWGIRDISSDTVGIGILGAITDNYEANIVSNDVKLSHMKIMVLTNNTQSDDMSFVHLNQIAYNDLNGVTHYWDASNKEWSTLSNSNSFYYRSNEKVQITIVSSKTNYEIKVTSDMGQDVIAMIPKADIKESSEYFLAGDTVIGGWDYISSFGLYGFTYGDGTGDACEETTFSSITIISLIGLFAVAWVIVYAILKRVMKKGCKYGKTKQGKCKKR